MTLDPIKSYLHLRGQHHAAEVCSQNDYATFLARLEHEPKETEAAVKEAFERSTREAFSTGLTPRGMLPSQAESAAAQKRQKEAEAELAEAVRRGVTVAVLRAERAA